MLTSPRVEVGTRIRYDGEAHTVSGFDGSNILIKSETGKSSRLSLSALFGSEDFGILGTDTDKYEPTFPDALSPEQEKEAQEMLEHLREANTGFRSGISDMALPHEPKPQYDPSSTTSRSRIASKAKELGISETTLWRRKRGYEARGLVGLVDGRSQKALSPAGKLDPKVRQAILDVLSELTDKSNHSKDHIRRLVTVRLDGQYGENEVPCPKKTAFNKALNEIGRGRGYFGSAKGRRNAANRPDTPYRRFNATRPGEFVLIDSTPLDAFAIDPVSHRWIGLQLTLALDLYTRSIIAWRFTARDAKAVDAALLLYDIIKPEPMRPDWDKKVRFDARYVGIPQELIIEAGFEDAAAIPVLNPETVVIDRGKVFLSQAFHAACEKMGINVHISRPRAPTDKSHIERVFKTIREQFVQQLPGYKGPDIYSRGEKIEDDAIFFTDEIEELFAEWVATYWQERHHDGLHLDGAPKMNVSPNDMYEEGIARAGFLYPVTSDTLYCDLLPTEWRTIQHYGVEVRGLRYDGDCLNYFRSVESPYGGEKKGKWPIRFDPRDLSRVFFYDIHMKEWKVLLWSGMSNPNTPFSDATVSYAKALLRDRGGNVRNHDRLEHTLLKLLVRIEDKQFHSKEERRLAARQAIQAQQAAKDRGMSGGNVVSLDAFRDEPYEPDAPAVTFDANGRSYIEGQEDYEDYDEDFDDDYNGDEAADSSEEKKTGKPRVYKSAYDDDDKDDFDLW